MHDVCMCEITQKISSEKKNGGNYIPTDHLYFCVVLYIYTFIEHLTYSMLELLK